MLYLPLCFSVRAGGKEPQPAKSSQRACATHESTQRERRTTCKEPAMPPSLPSVQKMDSEISTKKTAANQPRPSTAAATTTNIYIATPSFSPRGPRGLSHEMREKKQGGAFALRLVQNSVKMTVEGPGAACTPDRAIAAQFFDFPVAIINHPFPSQRRVHRETKGGLRGGRKESESESGGSV